MQNIISQVSGIIGLIIIVFSFQCKNNRNFFIMQGVGSFFFVINFLLIEAFGGVFFNMANLIRGLLFYKNAKKMWKLILIEIIYAFCFVFSILLTPTIKQIILASLLCLALIIMSVLMQKGNPKHIRYFQVAFMSPAWLIHNFFNFSIGGIICESFNMISATLYLLRYKKKN